MAHAGKLVKVYLDSADVGGAGATWVVIAQQDDLTLKRGTEKVDVRTKDDDGAPNDTITGTNWSLTFSGKLKVDDPSYIHLVELYDGEDKGWFKIDWAPIGGTAKEGQAIIELEEKAANNGSVEFSVTLTGQGKLTTSVV
jgi:predicted secreted protein